MTTWWASQASWNCGREKVREQHSCSRDTGGRRERVGIYPSPAPPLLSNPVPMRPPPGAAPATISPFPEEWHQLALHPWLPWQQEGLHTRRLTLGCKTDLKGQLHLNSAYIPSGVQERKESGKGERKDKAARLETPGASSLNSQPMLSPPYLSAPPNPQGKGRPTFGEVELGVSLQEEYTHTMPPPNDNDPLDPRGGVGEGPC